MLKGNVAEWTGQLCNYKPFGNTKTTFVNQDRSFIDKHILPSLTFMQR